MRAKLIVLILFLVVAVPFLSAWYLFSQNQFHQFKTSQKGTFVTPIHYLPPLASIPVKWKLAYIAPQDCQAPCQKTLYHLRQIKTALGKYQHRVQPLVIYDTNPLSIAAPLIQVAKQQWPDTVWPEMIQTNQLYIIDPQGQLVLHYPETSDPKSVLSDLKHLLKNSRYG